jgi:DNA repair protein RadC
MKQQEEQTRLSLSMAPTFIPRYRVCIVPDSRHRARSVTIHNSTSAAEVLRPFFAGLDREQFLVCALDAKHGLIGVNVVSMGSLTLSIVHPREVMKPLILLNASAWIAAHNHPSGDPTPSREDRVLTTRLREVSELMGLQLLDHVILGEPHLYSFADQGWPG